MSDSITKHFDTLEENPTTQIQHFLGDITGTQKAIKDFEITYPTLAKSFKEVQKEQYELFAQKMMDYGLGNISLGTNLEDKDDIQLSLTGIWLRCNDKINRLKNMLKRKGKNYVKDEPMIDSFIDIANYGIIAMLVMKEKWKK
jgi:hypothetical protein